METITVKHLLNKHRTDIEKQLGYLVNTAKRLKLTPPTWSFGEVYDFEFAIQSGFEDESHDIHEEVYIEPCFDITINVSETLKMDGNWIFACAIDHRAKVMIQVDETVKIPLRYSPSNDYCEHCSKKYPRVKSYVVTNQETGEFKQVGKGCLKQFLGINPASYITMFEAISKFSPMIEGYGGKNRGGRLDNLAYDVLEMFRFTAHQVQKDDKFVKPEWEERQMGETWNRFPIMKNFRTNEGEATLDKVNERLSAIGYFRLYPNDLNDTTTIEELEARLKFNLMRKGLFTVDYSSKETKSFRRFREVEHTISNIRRHISAIKNKTLVSEEIDSYNDQFEAMKQYMANLDTEIKEGDTELHGFDLYKLLLKNMFAKERTLQSNLKTIVSGYGLWLNALERDKANALRLENAKNLKYIGTVGQKSELTLKVIGLKTGEGQFGTWKLWKLEDMEGNKFSKFGEISRKYTVVEASPEQEDSQVQIGSVISVNVEIKEHKEFREEKITGLGRFSKVKEAQYTCK